MTSFWRQVAKDFANEKAVIGYELINEPFAGDVWKDPFDFIPGVAGSKNLLPMYDNIAKAIRESDENHIIFFEPVTWGMIFDSKIVGSGFDHVPGGDDYRNRSAFSYHYYCESFVPNWKNEPIVRRVICDDTIGSLVFKAVDENVKTFGGASMMTEFGDCFGNATVLEECN